MVIFCPSLSNHDVNGWKGKTKTENKEKKQRNQGQIALERVKRQKISINNNLYDACNECTYDACSNALKIVQNNLKNYQLT